MRHPSTLGTCPTCDKPLSGRGKCRSYAHVAIGPRKVGGVYYSGYWGTNYEVLAIDDEGCTITVRDLPLDQQPATVQKSLVDPTHIRRHFTAWDYRRDRVISQPVAA